MRCARILLSSLILIPPTGGAWAQGWPPWADDQERRAWRYERPYYRDVPERYWDGDGRPEPRHRPLAESVQDGGARPDIAPRAPHVVGFSAAFPANTIVIDTGARKLYYVLDGNRAYEYRISVGREGFNWSGTEKVSRKQAWPDWHPPAEMRERDPRLPEKMTGGLKNPLGAMALYLGNSLYRIHGTNDVKSIGRAQSSGCFRMLNAEVLHLASITEIGTPVSVVNSLPAEPEVSQGPESKTQGQMALESSALPERHEETPPSERSRNYQSLRQEMLRRP